MRLTLLGPVKTPICLFICNTKTSDPLPALLGLLITILQLHVVVEVVVVVASNDWRMMIMFQNTSSNLSAIYQPAEADVEQAWPEEPADQGDQESVLSWWPGSQGCH